MQNVYVFSMFAVTSCNMDQLWKIDVLYFITYLKSTVWKKITKLQLNTYCLILCTQIQELPKLRKLLLEMCIHAHMKRLLLI